MPSSRFVSSARLANAFLILTLFFIASAGVQAQSVIHVPGDQATIQAAINAAANGDTVLVGPGTYVENINFLGKQITVTSSGGSSVTIIDGGGNGSVVTFGGGETNSAVLSGFTVQNGSNYYAAGGIQITSASPTITGNVITANHAPSGLGIYINGGSPLIKGNTITGNTQIGSSGGGGGGIYATGSNTNPGAPLIVGNTINNNSLANGGNGGGIMADYYSTPTIQDNVIEGNSAYNNGGGIAVSTYGASIFVQNIIANNTSGAGGSGGGVYVFASSALSADNFVNNTIANNNATDRSSGIFVGGFPQMITITNNIVVAAGGQNGVTCNATYSPISAIFSHNDSYSLSGVAWAGTCDTTSHPGNFTSDPQFADAQNGDFHLLPSSPAIDAGDNSALNLPQTDQDGNARILDGSNSCTNTIDLGVYEVVKTIAASISPLSLAFASQVTGTTSSAQSATLTSSGQTCFQESGPQITGDFIQTNTCPAGGVPGGSACVFSIAFTPTAKGTRTGSLTVNGTNGTSLVVSLSGTGSDAATTSLSPGSLGFLNQFVGTTSSPVPVTLTNSGGSMLNISSIVVSGPFSQTNNCPTALAAGANCTISVSFSPVARGSAAGTLSIADNASGSPQAVGLAGTGVSPVVSLSTSGLVFGNQPLLSTSAAQMVTLSNVGDATLSLSGIGTTGDFAQTNNCGGTVALGASCVVNVMFAPAAPGSRSGSLFFTDNAPSGSPQSVSLNGTGVDFSISASPASALVVRGNSVNVTVTLNSVGGSFGDTVGLSCSGLPPYSACTFTPINPMPGNSGSTSTMTVSTNHSETPTGTFVVTISGQSGALKHSAQISLSVKKH